MSVNCDMCGQKLTTDDFGYTVSFSLCPKYANFRTKSVNLQIGKNSYKTIPEDTMPETIHLCKDCIKDMMNFVDDKNEKKQQILGLKKHG